MKCSPSTTTLGGRLGMIRKTYGWGSRIIASRFWAERSIWWFLSLAVISNSLFRRTNEAFSTYSTKRPLLLLPAPAKTKNVSNPMELTQQKILIGKGRSKPSLSGIFNKYLGRKSLSGCSFRPTHGPLTSTWLLAPSLFELGRPVTN